MYELREGFKVPYTVLEMDENNTPIPPSPGDQCYVHSSDDKIAEVIPSKYKPDAALGMGVILGKFAEGNVTITADITKADGKKSSYTQDIEVIRPLAPAVSGINLGIPDKNS